MKKYMLADEEARVSINLMDYSDTIRNAVWGVMEDDGVMVSVCKDGYYMAASASKIEEDRIKEILCASELGRYRSNDGVLFNSIVIWE